MYLQDSGVYFLVLYYFQPNPVKPIDPVKKLFMKHATEDGRIFAKELKHFLRELSGTGMYSTHIKSHEGPVKKYDD